jgi:hypothetical protein
MCFHVPASILRTVVQDGQARSESLLEILWEKEDFYLLLSFITLLTGSDQRT